MIDDCIIMAGGAGTRLWPVSNRWNPKQFLPMPLQVRQPKTATSASFFNAAIERALGVIGDDGRILIVSGKHHIDSVVRACQEYSSGVLHHIVLIPEPMAKNTAPVIACAASYIDWVSGEDRNVLVLTSDHIINPLEVFEKNVAAMEPFIRDEKLAVFGIKPKSPKTGYGYIEAGQNVSAGKETPEVYQVLSFHEKPNKEKAEEYLKAGNFYWNSGMFAFSSRFILKEFRRLCTNVIEPFDKLRAPGKSSYITKGGVRILYDWLHLEEAYDKTQAISFDYAVAEKCSNAVMVNAEFNWLDIGSWDEYARLSKRNNAEVYQINAKDCFVDSDMPVALIGTEDLIIAVRSERDGMPGSVLVAKKGQTQAVREIVAQIKMRDRNELL